MLEALNAYGPVDKGYLGDNIPNNPTMKVKFKRPEIANSPGTRYNDRKFSDDELKTIHNKLVELKINFHSKPRLYSFFYVLAEEPKRL